MSELNKFIVSISGGFFNIDIEKKIIKYPCTSKEYIGDLDDRSIKILKEYYNKTLSIANLYCVYDKGIPLKIIVQINIPFTDKKEEYSIVFKEDVKKDENFSFVCLKKEFKVIKNDKDIAIKYLSADNKLYISKINESEYKLLKDYVDKNYKKILNVYWQYVSVSTSLEIIIVNEIDYNLNCNYIIRLDTQTDEDKLREEILTLKETNKNLINEIERLKN